VPQCAHCCRGHALFPTPANPSLSFACRAQPVSNFSYLFFVRRAPCKKQKMKSFSFCVGVECSGTSIVPPHGLWSECSGWSACIILPCLIFQGPIVLLRGRHHSSIVVVIANSLALSGVALLKVCTENFAAAATAWEKCD
jgi:hypothetical protein